MRSPLYHEVSTPLASVRLTHPNSIMPPSHLTFAKPKSWLLKHGLHTIDIVSSQASLANNVAWFKIGVFSLKHQPSYRYLNMRQE